MEKRDKCVSGDPPSSGLIYYVTSKMIRLSRILIILVIVKLENTTSRLSHCTTYLHKQAQVQSFLRPHNIQALMKGECLNPQKVLNVFVYYLGPFWTL